MTPLVWNKCQGSIWCSFSRIDLNHPVFTGAIGVYIVFDNINNVKTFIKVGCGNIRQEILKDRANPDINKYLDAKITWARTTNATQAESIKLYLSNRLNPILREEIEVGSNKEEAVNLPWI